MLRRVGRIEESSGRLISIEQTFKVEVDHNELFGGGKNVPQNLFVRIAVESEFLEGELGARRKIDTLCCVP